MQKKTVVLTGDRPTGPLHLGHYVGSLQRRLQLQHDHQQYIMVADTQALTDHAEHPQTIISSVCEVVKDYIAVGIDPKQTTIFVQSHISALPELTMYFMNLVTVARLERNPTVKNEILLKGYHEHLPVGFYCYPISQAADILAFKAQIVPVGDDQLPMIELSNDIARKFRRLYAYDGFPEVRAALSQHTRLCGIDGKAKASKSLGNAIYLSDDTATVQRKVYAMYTDPTHTTIQSPGRVEGHVVFSYLDAFYPDAQEIQDLKAHYQRGGLGDMPLKIKLFETLETLLEPIRARRQALHDDDMRHILHQGTQEAAVEAQKTLAEVRSAIGLIYW